MSAIAVTVDDFGSESIRGELAAISEAHGVLTAPLVVERARDPASPLHDLFEWDREQAAEKFLLIQAAALIRRVKIHIVRASTENKVVAIQPTRAFVSPQNERRTAANPAGGYARVEHVLSDPERRANLLATARRDLDALRRKYSALDELAEVWAAIDGVMS